MNAREFNLQSEPSAIAKVRSPTKFDKDVAELVKAAKAPPPAKRPEPKPAPRRAPYQFD